MQMFGRQCGRRSNEVIENVCGKLIVQLKAVLASAVTHRN